MLSRLHLNNHSSLSLIFLVLLNLYTFYFKSAMPVPTSTTLHLKDIVSNSETNLHYGNHQAGYIRLLQLGQMTRSRPNGFPRYYPGSGRILSNNSLFLLRRSRRQSGPRDEKGPPIRPQETRRNVTVPSLTPVLPITGKKEYDQTDCMPLEEVAAILRSSIAPQDKSLLIEAKTCNLKHGLECLSVEDRAGSNVYRHRCRCMLAFGPKPVRIDIGGKVGTKCFIPAGLGWPSECNNKTWSSYGIPLPYGDPSGANAEKAVQTDAYNKPNGEQVVVDYIRWNSIKPECVPNSICRERGTYVGQRCQCLFGSRLQKPEGTCSQVTLSNDSLFKKFYRYLIGGR